MSDAATTRRALHRVAVHVVARARQQATGRYSLRVTPGGFGTPEFASDARRVRVSRGFLIVESDADRNATTAAHPIAGASLRELAVVAGVDVGRELDVGHDTPGRGDLDEPIDVDQRVVDEIVDWFGLVARALDSVIGSVCTSADSSPSLVRLWPEHFDVAVDVSSRPGVRVNVGGSPGDDFSTEPYLYVSPWTDDRPGAAAYWNAPFGAACPRSSLQGGDPLRSAAEFLLDGLRLLAG